MDIVDRLKRWAALKPGDVPEFAGKMDWGDALNTDLVDAIGEIDRLRSLAGAVTDGQSAHDIYAPMRTAPRDVPGYADDLRTAFVEKTSCGND